MQVNGDAGQAEAPAEGVAAADVAGAPDYLVLALRQADAAMRTALTALRYARDEGAHPSGLPVQRLAGLASDMTGGDIRFLTRTIEVLDAMPTTWQAFQHGQLSWSQLRGVVIAARPLRVADRAWLDDQLAGAITQAGEPDRVVQIATDLAGRCLKDAKPDGDVAELDRNRLVMQPTLDGHRVLGWFDLDSEGGATLAEATDAAADPPRAEDQPVDADGRAMPKTWGPCGNRSAQQAEGLIRLAAHFLGRRGGHDGDPAGQARPRCTVILPLAALTGSRSGHPRLDRPTTPLTLDRPDDPAVTARILWRLAGGRTRITRTSAARLACDATLIPLIVNGNHVPAAVGDAQSPITRHHRRAAAAADQGCRFPGCDAPAAWTDLHHVLWREHGGHTELANLVSLCRRCHTRVHQRGWQLTLHPDRTLTVSHGRWTFTSRPRLNPGPSVGTATPSPPARQPMTSQPGRPPPGRTSGHAPRDRASPDRASPDRASPDAPTSNQLRLPELLPF